VQNFLNFSNSILATTLFLIRPTYFQFNRETAKSNSFQKMNTSTSNLITHNEAVKECNTFHNKLIENLIQVEIANQSELTNSPDAIYPNNWFSTDIEKNLILYPLHSQSRRTERAKDLIDYLCQKFNYTIDDSWISAEQENKFLEGTGSMVLDRKNKIAFAVPSPRTSIDLFNLWCEKYKYEAIVFNSFDCKNKPIYHSNVIISILEHFVLLGSHQINTQDLSRISAYAHKTEKEIILLNPDQIKSFAANVIEIKNVNQVPCLILSTRALASYTREQKRKLERHLQFVHSPLSTIENIGGGGARCMVAELY